MMAISHYVRVYWDWKWKAELGRIINNLELRHVKCKALEAENQNYFTLWQYLQAENHGYII